MQRELARWVEARGIVTQAEAAGFIAGEPVRGSWWSHPASGAIFQALQVLAAHPDVLTCKLREGHVSFVHRRLWPAVLVVQRTPALWPEPSAEARTLLAQVRREGHAYASGKARLELERSLRVLGVPEHTPGGAHRTRLVPFETWAPPDAVQAATSLSLTDALAALEAAGFHAPPPAVRRTAPVPRGARSRRGRTGGTHRTRARRTGAREPSRRSAGSAPAWGRRRPR